MTYSQIIETLEALANPANVAGMARYGISPTGTLGVPMILREAGDDRNFVKKAVNWALRQIGKRNPVLNRLSVETAREIQKRDAKSARWIAADALRELTDEKSWYRWQKSDRKTKPAAPSRPGTLRQPNVSLMKRSDKEDR